MLYAHTALALMWSASAAAAINQDDMVGFVLSAAFIVMHYHCMEIEG